MIRRVLLASAALSLAAITCDTASAGSGTANLGVSASVTSSCTVGATAVAFGVLTSTLATTPVNATGAVTVNCTPGSALTISLNGGSNVSGTQRRIANGASYLNYTVTQPNAAGNAISSPAVAWGDGTALGSVYTATGTGSAQVLNVYGQLPAQAGTLVAGSYSDNITVTLTY